MVKPPKTSQLTAFLVREDVEDYAGALKEPDGLVRHSLGDQLGFRGALYVRPQATGQPWWLPFVGPGLRDELPRQINASTAAVLFLDVDERTLAFTFGRGRYLLREEAYERGFGLRTTLSAVAPEQIRSVDARTIDDLTVQTRAQASRATSLSAFGLDIARDLLNAVTGELPPDSFAKRLTGKDSVTATAAVDIWGLGKLGERLVDEYESEKYKENFAWVDHLRPVASRSVREGLDEQLVGCLKEQNLDLIHMAPPETVEWETIEGFYFTGSKREESHDYLSVHEYLGVLQDLASLDVEKLKRDRVRVQWANTTGPVPVWPVYHCLVAELRRDDGTYVLSGGDYYQADNDFVARVDRHLRELDQTDMGLPAHQSGDDEDAYNGKAARAIGGALVHKKLIHVRPGETPIEPCDIFTADRQFVHVKRRSQSSTLSHLFAQGLVSAQSFLLVPAFRASLKQLIDQNWPQLGRLIPTDDQPTPADFTVVYAIIARVSPDWPCSLPFLSRVHLSNAADTLSREGFRVATQCIPRA